MYDQNHLGDYDEDMLLDNSPLGQYLKEVSSQPFGSYSSTLTSSIQEDDSNGGANESYKLTDWFLKKKLRKPELLKSCLLFHNLSSITEEDQLQLHDLISVIKKELEDLPSQSETRDSWFLDKHYISIAFTILFLSMIPVTLTMFSFHASIIFILFVIAFLLAGWNFVYGKTFFSAHNIIDSIKDFSEVVEKCDQLLDKSVNHLKELEIINHGRIPGNSNRFTEIKSQNKQKGMKLRNFIISGLSEFFLKARINQRVLLQNSVEDCLYDYKEDYIASLPIDNFTDILCSPPPYSANGDGAELGKIKAITFCHRTLLSEFAYKAIITLYSAYNSPSHLNYTNVTDLMCAIDDLCKSLTPFQMNLQKYLLLSTKQLFSIQESLGINCNSKKDFHQSKSIDDLLHSAKVQLHSALARVDEIQQMCADMQSHVDNEEQKDLLKSVIVAFNLAVENGRYCVEDVQEQLYPIQKVEVKEMVSSLQTSEGSNKVTLFQPLEPEGDVLLEGESETVHPSEVISPEDTDESLKERRESRKLMRELKTVLSVKDTPEGLLSFPLLKAELNEEEEEIEDEFHCGVDKSAEPELKVENIKSAYSYDPDEHGVSYSDETIFSDNCSSGKPVMFGLPKDMLSMISNKATGEEVTFGSSSEDEMEAGGS